MEYGQADDSADEFEIVQMFRIDTRVRIDLKCVVIMCRIFKKAIEWIKHLVRQQKEELSVQ